MTSLMLVPLAQAAPPAGGPSMGTWIFVLGFLALAPFLFTLITSFAKLVIVGGIIRQALGTPQIPPTMVITGLALILSVHIMSPVAAEAWEGWQRNSSAPGAVAPDGGGAYVRQIADAAAPPLRRFLERHADPRNVALFERMQARLRAANVGPPAPADDDADDAEAAPGGAAIDEELARLVNDAIILVPAFLLTELTEAFQIGFLIFVPFLVIDLVASNILLAMGMHMLSPTTVSMPFKLLLFVLVDGWSLILQGVVLGYA